MDGCARGRPLGDDRRTEPRLQADSPSPTLSGVGIWLTARGNAGSVVLVTGQIGSFANEVWTKRGLETCSAKRLPVASESDGSHRESLDAGPPPHAF